MPLIMGAAAFLMAELLELEYTEIILAALVPSALYYLAVFVQADLEAAKNGIAPLPKERIPPFVRVVKEGWFCPTLCRSDLHVVFIEFTPTRISVLGSYLCCHRKHNFRV